jgi:hypothetical protein
MALIIATVCCAQPVVKMRTMWDRPQVHVKFEGYTISFTIKDINEALALIAETGDSTYGVDCGLDTNANYVVDLYPGRNMIYGTALQKMLHNDLGAFLITAKRAYIVSGKRREVSEVIVDVEPPEMDMNLLDIKFYDPRNKKLVFWGTMRKDMYNRDLGLD